jgi:hypothetical protein
MTPDVDDIDGVHRTFQLIPTEKITDQIRRIELPKELVPDITDGKNESKAEFNNLLIKLSKTNIRRNKNGFITVGNKVHNTNYDSFVTDCCNRQYKDEYEDIYCMLRDHGITF